jgi:hypothetical protein
MDAESCKKLQNNFACCLCNYKTSRKSSIDKHNLSSKHINRIKLNVLDFKSCDKELYTCNKCKKTYTARNSLWYHAKKCNNIVEEDNIVINIQDIPIHTNEEMKQLTSMVFELMKSNNELQKQMIEVCKTTTITNSNNINHINSHNKTFNLQFFLNEQCKDAMNLSDFANSFDLQLSDLESVGELGYVDGITKIIVDKLNSMDVYKRPMHCSDAKREIIYVKDENVWTKEEKDNPKLRQAIKNVSFRNMKLVYNWSNAYPESKDNQSRLNDKYMTLVIESTGGKGPILESENKIMRRIAKEIVIDKM